MAQVAAATSEVWVVIAAYNEGGVVAGVVTLLADAGYQVVVVDDGSTDETAARSREGGAHVVRHAVNRGHGAALQSGMRYALDHGARILVTFDADGQHSADDVLRLIAPINDATADIVLGSRFLENAASVPPLRRVLLRAAVIFTGIMSSVRLTDTHNGLRAMSRRAAMQVDLQLDRMAHASEIIDQLARTGLPLIEIPVNVRYTPYSIDKGQRSGSAARIVWDYMIGKWS